MCAVKTRLQTKKREGQWGSFLQNCANPKSSGRRETVRGTATAGVEAVMDRTVRHVLPGKRQMASQSVTDQWEPQRRESVHLTALITKQRKAGL